MNLEMLLEEENSIKGKITSALKALKEWFKKKIEQAKEIFETLKEKVVSKLRKNKDVPASAVSEVKSALSDAQSTCGEVVSDCKAGISAVEGGDAEKAADKKEKVIKGLKALAAIVGVVGGILAGRAYKNSKKKGEVKALMAPGLPEPKNESYDFNSLMEEIEGIGAESDVLSEDFDLDFLNEEFDFERY